MYGKKWNLDLVLSLSLYLRMVVLSVFWFILSGERFEGGLEENLLCYELLCMERSGIWISFSLCLYLRWWFFLFFGLFYFILSGERLEGGLEENLLYFELLYMVERSGIWISFFLSLSV